MYKIIYSESYLKSASKFIKKYPNLEKQYTKSLMLLELNPYHPSLRLHKLKGRHKNLYSISINIAFRLLIILLIKDNEIYPVSVGPHDEVYI